VAERSDIRSAPLTDEPGWVVVRWYAAFNGVRAAVRVPVKIVIFAAVFLLVLFPRPWLLVRHVDRVRHLDRLIEPNAPGLEALGRQLQTSLPAGLTNRQIHRRVEEFVHKTIPYDWDWNTWGVADYIPTVSELLEMRREDCDGRAVLAASLLRQLGQKSYLATDLRHVWVGVERDELMGPGGRKTAISTPTGTRFDWRTVENVPRTLAFGTAVFPLPRELIVLATMVLLLAHPKMRVRWLVSGTALLLAALVFLRLGVDVIPGFRGYSERIWSSWLGLIVAILGVAWLWWWARRARVQEIASP